MDRELQENADHVDHDMAIFLNLHRELRSPRFGLYPETVRRALHVAYATLLRRLLLFFHRPDRQFRSKRRTCTLPSTSRTPGVTCLNRFGGWSSTRVTGSEMRTSWRLT